VWGRVDPTITRVEISTPTGRHTATVDEGLFAAVWPGDDITEAAVIGFDPSGDEIAYADQLTCGGTGDLLGLLSPRLVVGGVPVSGGCGG
jgi:hypothetical protein